MKISDMDEYLHADAIADGDVIEILGKPKYITAEEATFKRAYFEFFVKLPNGKTKTWTPNKTTLKKLAKDFGDDPNTWLGKKAELHITSQNVRGEMRDVIYGQPAKVTKAQENLMFR